MGHLYMKSPQQHLTDVFFTDKTILSLLLKYFNHNFNLQEKFFSKSCEQLTFLTFRVCVCVKCNLNYDLRKNRTCKCSRQTHYYPLKDLKTILCKEMEEINSKKKPVHLIMCIAYILHLFYVSLFSMCMVCSQIIFFTTYE